VSSVAQMSKALFMPGFDEDQGRQKTGDQGAERHQSLHRGGNDVQSQAGPQSRQGAGAERPEGHGVIAAT